jgi:hypothetical protein
MHTQTLHHHYPSHLESEWDCLADLNRLPEARLLQFRAAHLAPTKTETTITLCMRRALRIRYVQQGRLVFWRDIASSSSYHDQKLFDPFERPMNREQRHKAIKDMLRRKAPPHAKLKDHVQALLKVRTLDIWSASPPYRFFARTNGGFNVGERFECRNST